jgi:hypothetical protein
MELMINGIKRSCDFPANAFAIFALRNDLDLTLTFLPYPNIQKHNARQYQRYAL